MLLLAGGLTGLFLTGDVFNFYVFFELAMTASYALTTYGGRRRQLRAALVFTAVNLLGSFIFLLSVAGTYRVTGTLAMHDVAERMPAVDPNAAILVAAGFFIAFSVKLGLFPFHFWLPTVYAGSRPAVAAILSGAVANIGAYGLLRFGPGMFPAQLRLAAAALVVLGAASLVYGAVLAVARGDVGETLAYSAIGQVGYVLVAIGVGGTVGLTAAVLYSAVNALNKTLLFLAVGIAGRWWRARSRSGRSASRGCRPRRGSWASWSCSAPGSWSGARRWSSCSSSAARCRWSTCSRSTSGASGGRTRRRKARPAPCRCASSRPRWRSSSSPPGCGPSRCWRSATERRRRCSRGATA